MGKNEIDGDTPATTATSATSATKDGCNTGLQWQEKNSTSDSIGKRVTRSAPINTLAEAHAAAKETSGEDFWSYIESLADDCDEVLRKEGYPTAMQSVMPYGNGQWRPSPTDFPRGCKPGDQIMVGFRFTQMHADAFSNAWYAAEVGHLSRDVLRHVANNKAGEAWLYKIVFYIASMRQNWEWRHVHSPSLLTGQKARKNLTELRTSHNISMKDKVDERRALVQDLINQTSLTGGALDNFLKRKLAELYGIYVGVRTLREDRRALGI